MPDPITAVMGGASVLGGISQRNAASDAQNAQEAAAQAQLDQSRETRDIIRADMAPYREGGSRAYNALQYEMGLADQPEDWQGISMTPASKFALEQGRDTIEAGASYGGGLNSGRAMQALEQYRMGLAQSDRASQLDRLGGMASSGQNAAAQTAAAETNNLSSVTNALGNMGNAQAAGSIGVGNAISGTMQNGMGLFQYQQGLNSGFGGQGGQGQQSSGPMNAISGLGGRQTQMPSPFYGQY